MPIDNDDVLQIWTLFCGASSCRIGQEQRAIYMFHGSYWMYQLCQRLCCERYSRTQFVWHVRIIVGAWSWTRGFVWNHFTSFIECSRQRCIVWLGCCSPRHVSHSFGKSSARRKQDGDGMGGETKRKREFVCRSGLIGMTARSACKESEKRSVWENAEGKKIDVCTTLSSTVSNQTPLIYAARLIKSSHEHWKDAR